MYNNAFSLNGKNILVTGASSGIGKSISTVVDIYGGNVFIVGRNADRLNRTFHELHGQIKKKYLCDILNDQEMNELVSNLPIVDGVVFCAGIIDYLPGKFITKEKIGNIFSTNFDAQILLYQKLHKAKKINTYSSLVFISSISSQIGIPGTLLYASSKAALNASVRVLASELAPQRIRVNSISPGIIKSPMIELAEQTIDKTTIDKGENDYPLGYGKPEDIAYAVVYFLSDASRWITGSNLIIDGGLTLI